MTSVSFSKPSLLVQILFSIAATVSVNAQSAFSSLGYTVEQPLTGQPRSWTHTMQKSGDYQLGMAWVQVGGMVGFAIGSLGLGSMVKRLDKKKTGILAMIISSVGGLGLFAVFTGGLLDPQASLGGFPLAVAVFGVLQMLWWTGCGIVVPLATAMIADLSEIKKWQTGEVTEGRYAAGFSFFLKLANSLGLLVTGFILKGVGYVSGAEAQAPEVINNLAVTTFVAGPILMLVSFFVLRRYPLSHEKMLALRTEYGVDEK